MMGTAHAASGVLLATATRPIADGIGADTRLWYAIWIGGVMLCDLDMHGTHGARVWGPPTRALGWVVGKISGGHRFETHNWKRAPLVVLAIGLVCVASLAVACAYLAGIAGKVTAGRPSPNMHTSVDRQLAAAGEYLAGIWPAIRALPSGEVALSLLAAIPIAAVGILIGISLRMVGGIVTTGTAGMITRPLRNPVTNLTTSIAAVYAAVATSSIWWIPLVVAAAIPVHVACDWVTDEGIPRARLRGPMPPGRVGLRLFQTDSEIGRACAPAFLALTGVILWWRNGGAEWLNTVLASL